MVRMEARSKKKTHDTHVAPDAENFRINLVKLVEIAVDDGVFREIVLWTGGDDGRLRDHFATGRFIVGLLCYDAILDHNAADGRVGLARRHHLMEGCRGGQFNDRRLDNVVRVLHRYHVQVL